MRRLIHTFFAIAMGATMTLMGGTAGAEILIKFSHVTAAKGHPKGEAAILFADRVNSALAGKVKVEVYPNSQLFNDNKVLEAMLLGDVQMAAPTLSKFEKYTKKFRIYDLPFLFKDINAVDAFQNSQYGQVLLESMNDKGLLGLAYWHNGMKQISANKPLIAPADASGLKFRIMTSDVLEAQFKALGANPQKMAFSEVYGALQTGVVDGQENTWSNIFTKKFFEVQDSVTESNHGVLNYLVVTSSEFWQGLPAEIRTELATILKSVTDERNAVSLDINMANREKVLQSGGKIRQLTDAERQKWINAMKPVWQKFEGEIGKDLIAVAQTFNK